MSDAACFFAAIAGAGPCRGRLQKCHLISKQRIKRALRLDYSPERLKAVVWDERVWVPGCELHHHRLDYLRSLTILREQLPPGVEEYAREHGLERFLEREYGAAA